MGETKSITIYVSKAKDTKLRSKTFIDIAIKKIVCGTLQICPELDRLVSRKGILLQFAVLR